MWFGTEDGLNKYDGYKFTNYKHDPNDSSSIPYNRISALFEDSYGELWIGTRRGLCKYDRYHDSFIRYLYDKDNPKSIGSITVLSIFESDQNEMWFTGRSVNRHSRETDYFTRYYPEEKKPGVETFVNYISSITQDSAGQIWIGTWNEGLFKYDVKNDRFMKYQTKSEYSKTFNIRFCFDLIATQWQSNNFLWFSSYRNGLYKINTGNDQITQYLHQPSNPSSLSSNFITSLFQRQDNIQELWIATMEGGVNILNIQTEEFTCYRNHPQKPWSLADNNIHSIYEDQSGLIWLGTARGIDRFENRNQDFQIFQGFTDSQSELIGDVVTTIHLSNEKDNQSIIWLGTKNRGLIKIDPVSNQITCYEHDPENKNSLSNNFVTRIIESHYGGNHDLWVTTLFGLNKLDLKTNRITRYYLQDVDIVSNHLYTLFEDKNGTIWIGSRRKYLYSMDPVTEKFTRHNRHSNSIGSLYLDSRGILWVGTGYGLDTFNPRTDEKTSYLYLYEDTTSTSSNYIYDIFEDENGVLWIGSRGGLNKFDDSTKTFTNFSEKDGLMNNSVKGILQDKNGNLWLSTNKGISRFDPVNKTFRNFDINDGLHGNEFFEGSRYQRKNGEMFFGGINGLTWFHPDSIRDNPYIPPVVLTDFQIFNKSIQPGIDTPLKCHISEVKEITLTHDQSVFSLEFAALDYHKPQKNKYAYKMEGVDPEWVYTDAIRRFATYTNLDPGNYIFRVKGSNNDGIWNEEGRSVKITILPPWWRTNLAYSVYAFFLLILVTVIWRFQTNRLKMKQQMEMEHFEAEKLREVDQVKSRFFANISHEFRTPLTLILGPVEQMLSDKFKGNVKTQYQMILRNGRRLLDLINQLLDLSKLESGQMKLRVSQRDILPYLKGIVQSFSSLAERKKITFTFKTAVDSLLGYIDQDKLEKIVTNLLSNAFKFTPEGGKINVDFGLRNAELKDNSKIRIPKSKIVEISISNTGPGIPTDQLDKIFDRFHQADNSYKKDSEGTGIGLALTKELIQACHGEIRAESELDKMTTFTVILPIAKEHFKPDEIVAEEDTGFRLPADARQAGIQDSVKEKAAQKDIADLEISGIPHPVASTQSPENRAEHHLAGHRSPLLLIVEDNPDVTTYISSFLESEYRIITAENGEEGWEKALKKYPDLVISDVMMPVMDGFELCKKLKTDERTSHIPVILLTARADMESKLEGLEFGADDYISKPFDSREIQVRVCNLLDQRNKLQSSSSFIRAIRLKRAAQMLRKHSGNISEVAYEVGFNNPSYFSECFHKYFGLLPSDYITQHS
jgi:signal transduction histidine kinase/ligand-binding sensor domain-containing protein/CheY-like chemotaxis protein